MKKKELEICLQSLKGFPKPRPDLEQYSTPASIAADMLYIAHGMGDIAGKRMVDLGCGTGILAVGAALLGAGEVTGIDIDPSALAVARENASAFGLDIEFLRQAVDEVSGSYDTCLMNPPFGSQSKHADRPFLEKAVELAPVTYGLHNSPTVGFIREWAGTHGCGITLEKNYKFHIPHTFHFHRKERAEFRMTLLRMVRY